ncbi:MAG: hypothetical protein K8S15_07100 [Candidatus Aegiribacteria sp.]|nr:hypothetical protein [Candidatus Aegiribacteria sp.]
MIRIFTVSMVLLCLVGCSLFIPRERPHEQGNALVLWLPGASSVQVLSDWNDWGSTVAAGGLIDPITGRMERDESGSWILDIEGLPAGVYRYAYFVNGYKWIRDPANPETAAFEGRIVSVIMIPD